MDHGTDDLMREMEKDTARPRRPRRRRRRRQDTVGYEEADFDTLFGDGIVCVEFGSVCGNAGEIDPPFNFHTLATQVGGEIGGSGGRNQKRDQRVCGIRVGVDW